MWGHHVTEPSRESTTQTPSKVLVGCQSGVRDHLFPWWKGVWIGGLVSSSAVAVMAALQGRVEGRPFCNPLNAISHIVGGRGAAKQREWTFRYTGLGLLLNGVACVFWAGFYQAWRQTLPKRNSGPTSTLVGIGTSVIAYITDYYVVPRRFTPGFELCLSRRSFPWLYGALALGLLFSTVGEDIEEERQ